MAIRAVIGLGNPGERYACTRHNIGFLVVDALGDAYAANWRARDDMLVTEVEVANRRVLLIKPQTFMNNSGRVISFLAKQGIRPDEIVVVHDELDFPFGKVASKKGGSARGHNGVKSLIAAMGEDFYRVRCGIGRPVERDEVPNYVLQQFRESDAEVNQMVLDAVDEVVKLVNQPAN
ncbi:MAG: aminoacyl-tRNA hydrolase [Candidatus Dependentiae bacterium]|nr:aminoacyl-tRNA hydrolase [Candidatus Dependentiae bacterium]